MKIPSFLLIFILLASSLILFVTKASAHRDYSTIHEFHSLLIDLGDLDSLEKSINSVINNTLIASEMLSGDIPALVYSSFNSLEGISNSSGFSGAFGYLEFPSKNPENPYGRPATINSIFHIASVSKTLIAIALMQLVEKNSLDLDLDINHYFGGNLNMRNPNFPNVSITLRQLSTHTASIGDGTMVMFVPGDSYLNTPLEIYLLGLLTPGGPFYNPLSWLPFPPGTKYSYSNAGAALVAWIIEIVSGMPYHQYVDQFIFNPLGMTDSTRWTLKDYQSMKKDNGENSGSGRKSAAGVSGVDNLNSPAFSLATSYYANTPLQVYQYSFPLLNFTDTLGNQYFPHSSSQWGIIEEYSMLPYPAGQLRSSVLDLSRILSMMANNGTWKGHRVLAPESIQELYKIQFPSISPTQCLFFSYLHENSPLWGHNGCIMGNSAWLYQNLSNGKSLALLSTADCTARGEEKMKNQMALGNILKEIYRQG